MLSPKYFLFYRVCAIIVTIVAILWWVKVPEEEIDSSEETPELVTLKEIINETERRKRST
jgi:hypothetical protein